MTALSDRDRELLLQTFLAESAENLTAMEHALVELESRPDDAETLHEIFRRAHSLKGDARMVGFTGVSEFAHAVDMLLRDADISRQLGQNGLAYVEREYRWPTVMGKLEEFLEAL